MKGFVAVLAMSSLVATPALGSVREAAFASSSDRRLAQSSMFAGAHYRVGLDRRSSNASGRASLKLSGMSYTPGSSEVRFGSGLELTAGKTGRPALHLAGQDLGQLRTKAQLSGTATAVIVGGVILLGVVAAVAVSEYERSQRCIGEEGDCD